MEYLFPISLAALLILFLATNFDLVATIVGYMLMVCLIAIVVGAIGYGLYEALGLDSMIVFGIVVMSAWVVTRLGYSQGGSAEGYRAGPGEKA
ncbi:MAG: hypothetical protein IT488_08670 [Gammaproteobacteria bacterium]|nr:hypothetical protein [Gammaproteobacteria bacterium]